MQVPGPSIKITAKIAPMGYFCSDFKIPILNQNIISTFVWSSKAKCIGYLLDKPSVIRSQSLQRDVEATKPTSGDPRKGVAFDRFVLI